ncbi:MAG: DUF3047 domain-containing protein [Gammaproteobacteria bacterium]|jgi:hypothetical protein|nr:DUF3047 domain-containing protein [Gammaproteobacteria bacterium]MBT3488261.1 DUF3047 domain-containing protein [Gammaproteobacteria bacterium]MBT3719910.1 DUF3047 domain-containing protein [Gammaproteobacteria bacterium]MBT3843826.1 DUF3047 domain-containing protein [Gammaproteobacteria bacterium]MBT3892105.1 DUF3047 domain-containing protein [Gammaproteobacteria bacterium]
MVGRFEAGELKGWQAESFKGETRYSLIEIDQKMALQAYSDGAASGLVRKIGIDLNKTPYLNWSWRVEQPLEGLDEITKQGDDYAARIYVIHSGGILFWQTRALNYVWSGSRPKGSSWPNAYTDRSRNIAVESGPTRSGEWVHYKRNIVEDLWAQFRLEANKIDAVALMTDTDNSQQRATAYYGNISFTAQ